jgi:hypothetical protein
VAWVFSGLAAIDEKAWGGLLGLLLLGLFWVTRRARENPVGRLAPLPRLALEEPPPEARTADLSGTESLNPQERTAILLAGPEEELGLCALESLHHLFPEGFRQMVIVSVGLLDYDVIDRGVGGGGVFRGDELADRLRASTRDRLRRYVARARAFGWTAGYRMSLGTSLPDECERLCVRLGQEFPQALFFLGKLVFSPERWYHRLMHGRTAEAIQRRLERRGLTVTVIPMVLPG